MVTIHLIGLPVNEITEDVTEVTAVPPTAVLLV